MWVTKDELKTHMNVDNIDVITGGDDTLVTSAIDGAVSEAKGYLADFDITAIFLAGGTSRNALLLIFVKDIAVWHLLKLSNYQADLDFRGKCYDRAVAWLKSVQRGDVTPDLPSGSSSVQSRIAYGSNEKREQHF
jgi:hypothetical protein